jgi:NAD(P)-dependent dehydrogenase (short-subunit alcohol dehydrogenase family)
MCARSVERGNAAITSVRELYPHGQITLLQMDHLSLSSIVSAAKTFLSRETALHGLINNAGIMATPFEITSNGHEAQWQTNYLAHWIFTSHLLPLLLKTSQALPAGSVRIVNLSSSGHWSAPKDGINFADTSLSEANGMARYGQSKLANVLHVKTLHKLYGPESPSAKAGRGEIWSSAVHPGLVKSKLNVRATLPYVASTVIGWYGAMGGRIDADKGSWTSLFCAASADMKEEESGTYFQRVAQAGWQSKLAKDAALAQMLEEWTRKEMEKEGWLE